MRETAATIKGVRGGIKPKSRPDPDSVIGTTYDLLRAYPAMPISSEWVSPFGRNQRVEILRDYGLDIRNHSRGWWWLVGEWDGPRYIDHIADRA